MKYGPARLLFSRFIRSIKINGRKVCIEWAKETSDWNRFECPQDVQDEFADVVESNKHKIPPGTALVAMKELEHQSDRDKRKHFTAFLKDENGKDLPTMHLIKKP